MRECAEELSHFVMLGDFHLPVADAVPEDDNVGGEAGVDLPVLDEGLHKGDLQSVHNLLTLALDGNGGVISEKESFVHGSNQAV